MLPGILFFLRRKWESNEFFVFSVRKCEIPSSNRDLQDGNHECCPAFRFFCPENGKVMKFSYFLFGNAKFCPAIAICKTEITNAAQHFVFSAQKMRKLISFSVFSVRKCEIPSSNRDLQDGNHKCWPAFRFSAEKAGKASRPCGLQGNITRTAASNRKLLP